MADHRLVASRYQLEKDILDNVRRFYFGEINDQMLCEQMHWGVRRAFAKELLEIAESGGDAFTRIRNVVSALKDEFQ